MNFLGLFYYWVFAVLLMIVLCDLTLYRCHGFAAPGCLFLLAPAVLWLGFPVRRAELYLWFVVGMLLLLSARLLWSGSAGLVLKVAAPDPSEIELLAEGAAYIGFLKALDQPELLRSAATSGQAVVASPFAICRRGSASTRMRTP